MNCQLSQTEQQSAHKASQILSDLGYNFGTKPGIHHRIHNGLFVCSCGHPLKPRELRNKVLNTSNQVANLENQGTFVIYEEHSKTREGHIYVKHNGQNLGDGKYDWDNTIKQGKLHKSYYKLR